MGELFDLLYEDIHFKEGLKACINCGTCTAICPAAEFYNYDPRAIIDIVQLRNDDRILELIRGEEIWYCGECMSCRTRCPRGNAPGMVIIALRHLSQETGNFVKSEKGRQQLALKRMIGETILNEGYCVHVDHMNIETFPEQGPMWKFVHKHIPEMFDRLSANYRKDGPGILRKMDDETLKEIKNIFDVTGATEQFDTIEKCSKEKASELGLEYTGKGTSDGYFRKIFTEDSQTHTRE